MIRQEPKQELEIWQGKLKILQGKLDGLYFALQEAKERLDYAEEWINGIRKILELD